MQHSVLNFYLNISVWSAARECDKDRATQSETETEVQKSKEDKRWKSLPETEKAEDMSNGREKDG